MGCAVVQVLLESGDLGACGPMWGVPAFDRGACAWSRAPSSRGDAVEAPAGVAASVHPAGVAVLSHEGHGEVLWWWW